ncbi:peptidoglycan editing factor PgeF [Rossellomorea sp. SC111]|uniref:peptidoglycan editing factor PgeF n=1 Tax=Rossellomorea sp. SC111 TaxID=2968985 RepID=UPI00215B6915|nr:peptidoglycan editing factor PgeF [Rossellomorea sp. SC111]MCR8848564.1 peptidoglycan editing factor PgeF [Rossellomorea sp. SC111]
MSKEPFKSESNSYYSIGKWTKENPKLVAGITTNRGGISEGPFHSFNMGLHVGDKEASVIHNRKLLASGLNMPLDRFVAAEQTHGKNISYVDSGDRGKGAENYFSSIKDTDGFLTEERNLLLTMCYADCVPLYFLDRATGTIGLAHAGWKGTVLEIGPKMVDAFIRRGSSISSLEVIIGPSICKGCYIVDDYVIDKVKKTLEDENNLPYNLKEEGQYNLDLKKLNRQLLVQSGLHSDQIHTSSFCSSCHDEFFSYRRDGGETGRIMSYIGWKE